MHVGLSCFLVEGTCRKRQFIHGCTTDDVMYHSNEISKPGEKVNLILSQYIQRYKRVCGVVRGKAVCVPSVPPPYEWIPLNDILMFKVKVKVSFSGDTPLLIQM